MNKSVLLLALGLGAGACHRAVPTTKGTAPSVSTSTAERSGKEAAVKAVDFNSPYLTAKGKVQATIKGDEKSATINIRMRRDSAIWVSAGLLGFEGVRALLTPDSVRVINRLDKTYFAGGYDYLTKLLNVPVSFAQAQALLLGNYQPAPAGAALTLGTGPGGGQRVAYPLNGVLVEQLLQAASGRVEKLTLTETGTDRSLAADYAEFQAVDGVKTPFAHSLLVDAKQGTVSTKASLKYSKVSAGREALGFPFDIPKGFQRMKGNK
ncbi:DUF4292 domain-containing protein [Hymenobacter coccineus]|uniref:DUF4292 domain-containing protein n=1 Tax=Hymenobacter coccineus TaxID=1908235 RepID=A0A1G1TKP7_9BACT|nr:DUF4292 domain-containing protein [Hymenobacter coccineus]OGX91425.1 hypothetical protein BEN49_19790 [Hymenobacter coccineus]